MHEDDILIVTEISRLGRSLLRSDEHLHTPDGERSQGLTAKSAMSLANNISSKSSPLLFPPAEMTSMISSRTKEALAGRKARASDSRPKGKLSATTKLTGKDDLIREYLEKKIPRV